MLAKIAARNVHRQIGSYLIYFITVSLTVALIFAVNNVIFSDELVRQAETIRELKSGLLALTIFVSAIVVFVLGYATAFMLRLRKREFGTYLTLGMTRRNILTIFLLETLLLCVVALGVGMVLGFFVYQGLMALITHMLEIDLGFAAYSVKGLVLTIALVTGVFLLSSVTSALYLKRVSIYELIHAEKKVDKAVRYPWLWLTLALLALAAILWSCLAFYRVLATAMATGASGGLFVSLLVLALAVVAFHIGLARGLVPLLLKSRRICANGTNTFTLRQLSGRLRANAMMAGALAFLIAFAVIGANVSFAQRASESAAIAKQYPFAISACLETGEEPPVSVAQAEAIIAQYAPIQSKLTFTIYTSATSYLHGFTRWSGEGYEGLLDSLVCESDYNRLCEAAGYEPVHLQKDFRIVTTISQADAADFSTAVLQLGGNRYPYGGQVENGPSIGFAYFYAIVPDEAMSALTPQYHCVAYDLADEKFDAVGLREALSYTRLSSDGSYSYERCDYAIREYGRMMANANSAVFVVGVLYIAVVFVFLAMAILAMKTLSGLADDKRRFAILFRLGASEREQSRTLFRQIFSFFFLPFALPMLLSIPTGICCARILQLAGFAAQIGEVYAVAGAVALVFTVIYLLYFAATYLVAKRAVVHTAAL